MTTAFWRNPNKIMLFSISFIYSRYTHKYNNIYVYFIVSQLIAYERDLRFVCVIIIRVWNGLQFLFLFDAQVLSSYKLNGNILFCFSFSFNNRTPCSIERERQTPSPLCKYQENEKYTNPKYIFSIVKVIVYLDFFF